MSFIDPNSCFPQGYDSWGKLVSLGDIDSDGCFVGYISGDGLAWESRRECDEAITAGRFMDAWNKWNRAGGLLGTEPQPEEFAAAIAIPENYLFALKAAQTAWQDYLPGGIFHIAVQRRANNASLN